MKLSTLLYIISVLLFCLGVLISTGFGAALIAASVFTLTGAST